MTYDEIPGELAKIGKILAPHGYKLGPDYVADILTKKDETKVISVKVRIILKDVK